MIVTAQNATESVKCYTIVSRSGVDKAQSCYVDHTIHLTMSTWPKDTDRIS